MAIETVVGLVGLLRRYQLLEPAQLDALNSPQAQAADPRALAKTLIQKGWLTPYQVNHLLQGKAQELVLGSYVLLERLGEGGMGMVFKARHQKMGRIVALKVIRKDRLASAEARKRFHREIQAVAQLSHPNVVMAFDADKDGDQHFFAMEYIEGTDLGKLVRERGPLPVRDACQYLREAALGLQHAHERGLVHRDIKPSNIILTAATKGPRVKLMDMGLVALRGSEDEGSSTLTQEGCVVGTPDYIAPEQARDARLVDIRGDLYSLGCTAYFLLTGQAPFSGGTLTEKLLKHHWDAATPIEKFRPEAPPAVSAIVQKLMAKRPEERFQTPADLVAALDAVLDPNSAALTARAPLPQAVAVPAHDTTVLNGTTPSLRQPPVRRRKLLFLGGAAGLVFLLIAAFVALRPSASTTVADTHKQAPANPTPFDQLRREDIAAAELSVAGGGDPKQAPPGLVAILGDSRLKHWDDITWVTFRPDGKAVASASHDGSARLWDARTGQFIRAFNHPLPVFQVVFCDNGKRLATWSFDRSIKYWDADTGKELHSFQVPELNVTPAFSPDGSRCVVGAEGRTVLSLREVSTGKHLRTLRHPTPVAAMAYTADGKTLAAAGVDGNIRLWDMTNEGEPGLLSTPQSTVSAMAFSPNGKLLATGSGRDANIKIWDLEARRELHTFNLQGGAVLQLAFSPDNRTLAAGLAQAHVRLWDVSTGAEGRPLAGHNGVVRSVAFSPDGKLLASSGIDYTVRIWEVDPGRPLAATVAPHGGPALAVSPDGKYVVWGGRDKLVSLWDVTARKDTTLITSNRATILSLAFNPNGKSIAGGGDDGSVYFWDVPGASSARFGPRAVQVRSLAFNSDGKTLVTGGTDGSVRLCDGSTGRQMGEPMAARPTVFVVAFSPSDKAVAAGCADFSIHLWDVPQRTEKKLTGHTSNVLGLAFSPDSKLLASAGADATVRLWDAAGANELHSFVNPRGMTSVAFSPDGKALAAASRAGNVMLYDVARREKTTLTVGPSCASVSSVAFTPDGRHIVTANGNGTVYILRLSEN